MSRGRIDKWERLTRELHEVLSEEGGEGEEEEGEGRRVLGPRAEASFPRRQELEERYRRELESLDGERRAFEDLEFRQLEREARREEEREALAHRADRVRAALTDRQVGRPPLRVARKGSG